jgi:hypothetical protein
MPVPGPSAPPIQRCPADGVLAAYVENKLSAPEVAGVLTHVSACPHCLGLFAALHRQPLAADSLPADPAAAERLAQTVRGAVRQEYGESLLAKFREIVRASQNDLRSYLEQAAGGLVSLIQSSFVYPTPVFAPAAGPSPPAVLSPFGKMRFPILFRWEPYLQSDSYELFVPEAGWSTRTTRSRLLVAEGQALQFGREYSWRLEFHRQSDVLAEAPGAFSVLSAGESQLMARVEERMQNVEPEADRLTLWGGLLEHGGLAAEAVQNYRRGHLLRPSAGLAYRIACCFDRFGMAHLRDRWIQQVVELDAP